MSNNDLMQASHASHSPGLTSSQPVQRVKSMFGQSTGKLPPPRLPQHPPPPQRSISHSEVCIVMIMIIVIIIIIKSIYIQHC